jgi:hypothetical protein
MWVYGSAQCDTQFSRWPPVLRPKTSKTLFGPVLFSILCRYTVYIWYKINTRIWFGAVNSNFHFEDWVTYPNNVGKQSFDYLQWSLSKPKLWTKNGILYKSYFKKSPNVRNICQFSLYKLDACLLWTQMQVLRRFIWFGFIVFNATFNNISVISWQLRRFYLDRFHCTILNGSWMLNTYFKWNVKKKKGLASFVFLSRSLCIKSASQE